MDNSDGTIICLMLSYGAGILGAISLLFIAGPAAEAEPIKCGSFQEPQSYKDSTIQQPTPLIFGKEYQAPVLRIRLIDGATQLPLQVKSVAINYGWKWWIYPYSEHVWGVWEDAADRLDCQPDKDGWIDAPLHLVRPRGWYEGKYTRWPWNKTPHFEEVEVVAFTGYFARTHLRLPDLQNFRDKNLVITVFDGWRTQTKWQAKITAKN